MSFSERMLKIDRRIIFLVIGLCTLLPLLYPVGLPIKISPGSARRLRLYRVATRRVGVSALAGFRSGLEARAASAGHRPSASCLSEKIYA